MEKKALGKGLDALLPIRDQVGGAPSQIIQQIPLEQILPNRHQPRKEFTEGDLRELAESIKQNGILQPVLVRRTGDGFFELIVGERRFRAAKMAKLSTLPAIVRTSSDDQSMFLALVENIQRRDLNPMEEARAYSRLMTEFGLTQEILSDRVGKDRSSIANVSRLLTLPSEIQKMVESDQLTLGHAKVILGARGVDAQRQLARRIVQTHLSVRDAEKLLVRLRDGEERRSRGYRPKNGSRPYPEVEEELRKRLGTKVVIRSRGRGGEIAVGYFSKDDLSRIVEVILA